MSVRVVSVEHRSLERAMSSTPQVSVVIPVFNAGAYLTLAVESVLAQRHTDFELLVVNDGSTDGAPEALREIGDSRLTIFNLPINRGVVEASNMGIALARAPLTAMMDADDIAEPDRLALQVARLSADPALVLLGSAATMIDAGGNAFGAIRPPLSSADIRSTMFLENAFVHSSVMFRTEIIRQLGGYSTQAPHAQDYELFLRIALEHPCWNLEEPLVRYRVHSAQDSQRHLARQRETATRVQHAVWAEGERRGLTKGCNPPQRPNAMQRLLGVSGTLGGDYRNWAAVYSRMGRQSDSIRASIRGLCIAPLALALYAILLRSIFWMIALRRGRTER